METRSIRTTAVEFSQLPAQYSQALIAINQNNIEALSHLLSTQEINLDQPWKTFYYNANSQGIEEPNGQTTLIMQALLLKNIDTVQTLLSYIKIDPLDTVANRTTFDGNTVTWTLFEAVACNVPELLHSVVPDIVTQKDHGEITQILERYKTSIPKEIFDQCIQKIAKNEFILV